MMLTEPEAIERNPNLAKAIKDQLAFLKTKPA